MWYSSDLEITAIVCQRQSFVFVQSSIHIAHKARTDDGVVLRNQRSYPAYVLIAFLFLVARPGAPFVASLFLVAYVLIMSFYSWIAFDTQCDCSLFPIETLRTDATRSGLLASLRTEQGSLRVPGTLSLSLGSTTVLRAEVRCWPLGGVARLRSSRLSPWSPAR